MVLHDLKTLLQGDHVALLSAFAEMGLKLRLDIPEQAMEVTTVFFRTSTPANEAFVSLLIFFLYFIFKLVTKQQIHCEKENMKSLTEQRSKNLKVIQEKMKLDQKEVKRFNPVSFFW